MSKDEVLRALFLIVQWDYAEPVTMKNPVLIPYPFKGDPNKYANKVLREAKRHLTPVAADTACAYDHTILALEGHSTCPECGAIPPCR